MRINDKNCSLSIALTAMDQKMQKSWKGDTTHHHSRLNVNVMLSNITFNSAEIGPNDLRDIMFFNTFQMAVIGQNVEYLKA